jgi:hypothetical protein
MLVARVRKAKRVAQLPMPQKRSMTESITQRKRRIEQFAAATKISDHASSRLPKTRSERVVESAFGSRLEIKRYPKEGHLVASAKTTVQGPHGLFLASVISIKYYKSLPPVPVWQVIFRANIVVGSTSSATLFARLDQVRSCALLYRRITWMAP